MPTERDHAYARAVRPAYLDEVLPLSGLWNATSLEKGQRRGEEEEEEKEEKEENDDGEEDEEKERGDGGERQKTRRMQRTQGREIRW